MESSAINHSYIKLVSDYMPLTRPRMKRLHDIDGSILPLILIDSGEDP